MKDPKEILDKTATLDKTLTSQTIQVYTPDKKELADPIKYSRLSFLYGIPRKNYDVFDAINTPLTSASIADIFVLNGADSTFISSSYSRNYKFCVNAANITTCSFKGTNNNQKDPILLPKPVPSPYDSSSNLVYAIAVSQDKSNIAYVVYGSLQVYSIKTKQLITNIEYRESHNNVTLIFKDNTTILVCTPGHPISVYSTINQNKVDTIGSEASFHLLLGDKESSWFSIDRYPIPIVLTTLLKPYIASNKTFLMVADFQKLFRFSYQDRKWQKFDIPKTLENELIYNKTSWAFCYIALSGNYVVCSVGDHNLHVWSLDGKYRGVLKGHTAGVRHLKTLNDEGFIISSGLDNTVRLWSLENIQCLKAVTLPDTALAIDGFMTEKRDACVVAGFADGHAQFEPLMNLPLPVLSAKAEAGSTAASSAASTASTSLCAMAKDKKTSADIHIASKMYSGEANVSISTVAQCVSTSCHTAASLPSPSAPPAPIVFSQTINIVSNTVKDEQTLKREAEKALKLYLDFLQSKDKIPRPNAAQIISQLENSTPPSYHSQSAANI